jgi:hypothetical protein
MLEELLMELRARQLPYTMLPPARIQELWDWLVAQFPPGFSSIDWYAVPRSRRVYWNHDFGKLEGFVRDVAVAERLARTPVEVIWDSVDDEALAMSFDVAVAVIADIATVTLGSTCIVGQMDGWCLEVKRRCEAGFGYAPGTRR